MKSVLYQIGPIKKQNDCHLFLDLTRKWQTLRAVVFNLGS